MTTQVAQRSRSALDLVSDWYLPESNPADGYAYPGPVFIKDIDELIDMAIRLGELCREKGTVEFIIRDQGRVYRGHRIESVEGTMYALRRVPNFVPALDQLGLDRATQALLVHPRLSKGGLVIIAGETGQGKSTTAAATIRARLTQLGAFCLTVEDPPELPLNGKHGERGMCVQTDARSGSFSDAMRGAMRCYPTQGNSILFVGETRDPETAGEVLRIATNGHLVITTIHGADVLSSMKRFLTLAISYRNMTEVEAKSVFSSAFRLAVHQRLRETGESGRRIEAKVLFSPDHSSPVANRIRTGTIEALATDLQQQAMLMRDGQVEKLLALFDTPSSARDRITGGS